MQTPSQIVSYVLKCVLSCTTFYLTDSLQVIANVVVPRSLSDGEDGRTLVALFRGGQSSLQPHLGADDPLAMFAQYERLSSSKRAIRVMPVNITRHPGQLCSEQ
jgi:hypothetical protein